ncbi:MAG: hypothetical protein ACK5BQ_07340 [Ignavibacteria bacterium]|jgi:hypothetical protein
MRFFLLFAAAALFLFGCASDVAPTPDTPEDVKYQAAIIDDQTAGPELPQSADSAYRTWFNNSIIYSYYPKTAPWTRLGYTYDWNGQYGERGLSELVVRRGAACIIHSVQSTADDIK